MLLWKNTWRESSTQPRSQGLSSYRPLERTRKDPGTRWSRASQNLGDDN